MASRFEQIELHEPSRVQIKIAYDSNTLFSQACHAVHHPDNAVRTSATLCFLVGCAYKVLHGRVEPVNTLAANVSKATSSLANLRTTKTGIPAAPDQNFPILVYQAGFAAICHLFKPIRTENKTYIQKRWDAFVATTHSTLPKWGTMIQVATTDTFLTSDVISNLEFYLLPCNVLRTVNAIIRASDTPKMTLDLLRQVVMVAEYSGMTSIQQMYSYARAPSNLAIVAPAVLDQATRFIAAYNEIRNALGENFPFAKTLDPASLLRLKIKDYPDLYVVAIQTAQRNGDLTAAFQMSKHPTQTPRLMLQKLMKEQISPSLTLTEDQKNKKQRLI